MSRCLQAAALAMEHGWSINLGGGMHHAHHKVSRPWFQQTSGGRLTPGNASSRTACMHRVHDSTQQCSHCEMSSLQKGNRIWLPSACMLIDWLQPEAGWCGGPILAGCCLTHQSDHFRMQLMWGTDSHHLISSPSAAHGRGHIQAITFRILSTSWCSCE